MTARGSVTGRRSRLSRRRLPPEVLTLLCLAPALNALAAIAQRSALALLAVHAARVVLPATLVTLALATTPLADAPKPAQRRG